MRSEVLWTVFRPVSCGSPGWVPSLEMLDMGVLLRVELGCWRGVAWRRPRSARLPSRLVGAVLIVALCPFQYHSCTNVVRFTVVFAMAGSLWKLD